MPKRHSSGVFPIKLRYVSPPRLAASSDFVASMPCLRYPLWFRSGNSFVSFDSNVRSVCSPETFCMENQNDGQQKQSKTES